MTIGMPVGFRSLRFSSKQAEDQRPIFLRRDTPIPANPRPGRYLGRSIDVRLGTFTYV